MDQRYPLFPGLEAQGKTIPVYLDICDKLVESYGLLVSYEAIFDIVSERLAVGTVKGLLASMATAGIITRRKNGRGRFAAYDKVALTWSGMLILTRTTVEG
jgi:hypothetical protein